jgi:hypothetical protein
MAICAVADLDRGLEVIAVVSILYKPALWALGSLCAGPMDLAPPPVGAL